MLHNAKGWWGDLPFRKKLRFSFIAVVMAPVILLGGFSYFSAVSYVHDKMVQETTNIAGQNILDISSKMRQCEMSLTYAVCNYSLQEFLSAENASPLDISAAAYSYIGPLLYNILLSGSLFDKLEIFMPRDIGIMNALIKSDISVRQDTWYRSSLSQNRSFWWFTNGNFYISRRIVSVNGQNIGVMRIRIKQELFNAGFTNYLHIPMTVEIREQGEPIYIKDMRQNEAAKKPATLIRPLPGTDWDVYFHFNQNYFSPFKDLSLVLAFSITVLCLVLVACSIHFLSGSLVGRILRLTGQIHEVRNGVWDVKIDTAGRDEIGEMARSFDDMLKRISALIDEVYTAEIREKDMQLQLLQAKIKPHFLYNNLSAINWIAMENGQEKICKITNALSSFYRTALNQGKVMSILETEIANAVAYMDLQMLSHDSIGVNEGEGLRFTTHIQKGFEKTALPCFILQPLLENAVEHGTDRRRNGGGEIDLSVSENDGVLHLVVRDNGDELYHKIGPSTLDKGHYGYGLSNVDQRIQLSFGEPFEVWVKASPGGTSAGIILPLNGIEAAGQRERQ